MPVNERLTAKAVSPEAIRFEPSFREACAANRCLQYGKSWSCPPAVGDLASLEAEIRAFPRAFVLRSVWPIADEFDLDGMLAAARKHDALLLGLLPRLPAGRFLLLGAGACPVCGPCTYPAAPCRYPEKRLVSLEACAIDVTALAAAAGLDYRSAPGTVAYFGLLLLD